MQQHHIEMQTAHMQDRVQGFRSVSHQLHFWPADASNAGAGAEATEAAAGAGAGVCQAGAGDRCVVDKLLNAVFIACSRKLPIGTTVTDHKNKMQASCTPPIRLTISQLPWAQVLGYTLQLQWP
jgi:hypothetical protein